jgi:uncharacterized protein
LIYCALHNCATQVSWSFVVPAKAGTQWRVPAKDAGSRFRGNDGALQLSSRYVTPGKLSRMKPRIVKCPQCNAPVPWTPESKWRPFCSERCKLIDLGAWASERYRIETPDTPDGSGRTPDQRGEDL